ncbi:unnamed protein product [Rotaria sp. Silwood1]|nr:unnamed protein product [Rotaria sp. Silwood1]
MERRRLQQQKMKEQQRFCVSQQDLTKAITHMKTQRHATYNNIMNISSSSSLSHSIDTLTIPSVSQIIKDFDVQSISTPYLSAQDFIPINNDIISDETESDCFQRISTRTIKTKVNNNNNNNISYIDNDQTLSRKIHQDQFIGDKEQQIIKKEQIDQRLNNDHYKRELPSSSSSSSYYSIDSNNNNNNTTQMVTRNSIISKRYDKNFREIFTKETQLNNALADLISLSNDADISSSISSPSRSLTNISQHRRTSSTNDNTNSISASIALLNNLLETFDLDDKDFKKNINDQKSQKNDNDHVKPINMFWYVIMSDNVCANCHQSFATNEQIVNAAGQIWHTQCFVCAQCFQPFEKGIYFEHEDRKYCERDFQMLFAPCCAECKQSIVGRVIRALQKCFHPDCFRCQLCHISLLEIGFSKNNDRALCRECYTKEKAKDSIISQHICSTCQQILDNKYIKYKGEYYHAYHFQCSSCRIKLDENAREARSLLYCQTCYNKLDLPICAACRCLIDDRVVSALGKQWHVEHFCCARCAQPFHGSKHYENNGLAYCEIDYHILFGSTCFICNRIITEGAYTACNKKYCVDHFACSKCEMKMNEKSKFFDVDATPVCKQCYEKEKESIPRALAYTITSSKISSSCTTASTLTSNSFDETNDQSISSMTTTSSSRRLSGRTESNTIPTPRIHSSIDTNLLNNSISNTRRSRKSIDNKILYPNNIILEPLSNNKNINYYIPPIPDISLNESEQKIKTKYTELLINFFETHQPSYVFEPLRKEYY